MIKRNILYTQEFKASIISLISIQKFQRIIKFQVDEHFIFLKKTMENVRKHRGIKLVATEEIKNYLVSEPNYHATIFFQKIY